jgi:glycosyltransferase involved in cell wall biosynthesis
MALGCPVVASRAGALPEVLGDAALYADPTVPESFIEPILRIVDDDSLRRRLTAEGLTRARRYTWSNTARQLLSIAAGDAADRSEKRAQRASGDPSTR